MNTYSKIACAIRRAMPLVAGCALAATVAAATDDGPAASSTLTADQLFVLHRADVRQLPLPLKTRLVELAGRPHTYNPMRAFAEADKPSQLFQYYLLDTT